MILRKELITRITFSRVMEMRGVNGNLVRFRNIMKLYHDDVEGECRTIVDLIYWTRMDPEGIHVLVADRYEDHKVKFRRIKGYDPATGKWVARRSPSNWITPGREVKKLVDEVQELINTDFVRTYAREYPSHRFNRKPDARTVGELVITKGTEK